jgi:hypothetical protein
MPFAVPTATTPDHRFFARWAFITVMDLATKLSPTARGETDVTANNGFNRSCGQWFLVTSLNHSFILVFRPQHRLSQALARLFYAEHFSLR